MIISSTFSVESWRRERREITRVPPSCSLLSFWGLWHSHSLSTVTSPFINASIFYSDSTFFKENLTQKIAGKAIQLSSIIEITIIIIIITITIIIIFISCRNATNWNLLVTRMFRLFSSQRRGILMFSMSALKVCFQKGNSSITPLSFIQLITSHTWYTYILVDCFVFTVCRNENITDHW